jgi:hypothetical protein
MDSDSDTACAVGCPIRKSRDQRLLASPPGLSQRATSFIASQCQGIHQMPFISRLSTTPNGKDQTALLQNCPPPMRQTSLLKTHVGHAPAARPPRLAARLQVCRTCPPRSRHTRYSPVQSTRRSRNTWLRKPRIGTSCRIVQMCQIRSPFTTRRWWR